MEKQAFIQKFIAARQPIGSRERATFNAEKVAQAAELAWDAHVAHESDPHVIYVRSLIAKGGRSWVGENGASRVYFSVAVSDRETHEFFYDVNARRFSYARGGDVPAEVSGLI